MASAAEIRSRVTSSLERLAKDPTSSSYFVSLAAETRASAREIAKRSDRFGTKIAAEGDEAVFSA